MQIKISPEIDRLEYFDDSENAEGYDPILKNTNRRILWLRGFLLLF